MPVLAEPEYEVEDASPNETMPERYELIDGKVVGVEEMGVYSGEVANLLRDELAAHGKATKSGRARMELLFPIPTPTDPDRLRRPDCAFISFDRWPEDMSIPFQGNPAPVVPDLAVEVVSPSDNGDDIVSKLNEYLRAGVRMVWLIFPNERQLYSYTSPKNVRVFTVEDNLDGGEVLPGFRFPMASLFPARAETKP